MVERSDTTGYQIIFSHPARDDSHAFDLPQPSLSSGLFHQRPGPLITPDWRSQLHDYLGGTTKGLGARSQIVGGTTDHVHLLIELKATHTLANFVRELKKASSMWVHEAIPLRAFAWQEGYAAFTVSASGVDEVRRYIENQEEHHRSRGFREELKIMLLRSGVEFEERYLD